MATMKAVQVRSPGAELELVEREIPRPRENEVLIRIAACGVCHGDAVAKEGHFPGLSYPRVPGHEVVGIVQETGSLAGWLEDRSACRGWLARRALLPLQRLPEG